MTGQLSSSVISSGPRAQRQIRERQSAREGDQGHHGVRGATINSKSSNQG